MFRFPGHEFVVKDGDGQMGITGVQASGDTRGVLTVEDEARGVFLEESGEMIFELGGGEMKGMGDVPALVSATRTEVDDERPGVDATNRFVRVDDRVTTGPAIDLVRHEEGQDHPECRQQPGMVVGEECEMVHEKSRA